MSKLKKKKKKRVSVVLKVKKKITQNFKKVIFLVNHGTKLLQVQGAVEVVQ